MRFDLTPKINVGDVKIVNRFLWFPITIGNERRWLERSTIQYEYYEVKDPTSGSYKYWRAKEFIDQ